MSAVFVHHVIGDLTVGKPDLVELFDTDPLETAARAVWASPEASAAVFRRPAAEAGSVVPPVQERFVGLISAIDIVGFLARAGGPSGDHLERENLMKSTRVGEVVAHDPSALREVDPGTRLIDAMEMMKQGVKRLVVRKILSWRGMSKRFSILFNGKWLKTATSAPISIATSAPPASTGNKFCCLSREDLVRFLIGCLGALAPLPLSSLSSLNAINPNYTSIESSSPALEVITKMPLDPPAVAVVETGRDGVRKIIGDISAYKLWKCDYLSAAWAVANYSAGQFAVGVSSSDENGSGEISLPESVPLNISDTTESAGASPRAKRFSSRSIGFFNNRAEFVSNSFGRVRSLLYRGRSAPLTCRSNNSLAAVMAQMLSHRATHVWVTDHDADQTDEGILVGVVGYVDILKAVTSCAVPSSSSSNI